MIDQHLYIIVPEANTDGQNIELPMAGDYTYLLQLGWQIPDCTACVVCIGRVNGKAAHHLYFTAEGWAELTEEIAYQADIENPWTEENIVAAESDICISSGVMICLDLGHLKTRDPDFATVETGNDPDTGETWERPVVIDTTIMV